jgi:hypothetical protein
MEGSCEHYNELSGSTKYWVILQLLPTWRLLKKTSATCSQAVKYCLLHRLKTFTLSNTFLRARHILSRQPYIRVVLHVQSDLRYDDFGSYHKLKTESSK